MPGVGAGQSDLLVTNQSSGAVDRRRLDALAQGILLGSQDEITTDHIEDLQTGEIQISTIHDRECTTFRNQVIQTIHVMEVAVGNGDECGNVPFHVEQGVSLDCRLGSTTWSPRA